MVIAHDRMPLTKPLPDLVLQYLPTIQEGFKMAEWIMIILFIICLSIAAIHNHWLRN
jgi:hypothetical protein